MMFGQRAMAAASLQTQFGDNLIAEFPPVKHILDKFDPMEGYDPVDEGCIIVKAIIHRNDKALFDPHREEKVVIFKPRDRIADVNP